VADPAVPILRPWSKTAGLQRAAPSVRHAVQLVDDGQTNGKVLLSALLRGGRELGGGAPGLALWALQLQGIAEGAANYLARFFLPLQSYSERSSAGFLRVLATQGIAVGVDSGYFDDLTQMDGRLPVPADFLDPQVPKNGYARYLDGFETAKYHPDYRPAAKGNLSRVLQLSYADGRRLDVDYLRVCDNWDPASLLSLMRSRIGPAGIAIPARISRNTAPRLHRKKMEVLGRQAKYNKEFDDLIKVMLGGLAEALPIGTVGQVVPLKQAFVRPVVRAAAPAKSWWQRGAEAKSVASGRPTAATRATEARLATSAAVDAIAQERRVVAEIVDVIEERSVAAAIDDPAFMDLLNRGRAGVKDAGTRFHRIAELEGLAHAQQGRLPTGYTLQVEKRYGTGPGSSRIDLLITAPSARPYEFDWKTSVLSGLSKHARDVEMPKHAAAVLARGLPLAGQESRSWGPAVVRMLRRAGRIESLTPRQRQALAPWL
jgi:hypothetical protein